MADVTIESIAIEITAAADEADKSLERITKTLETLKAACQTGFNGVDKVAQGLRKIADAAHNFDSLNTDNIKGIASALQSIARIKNVPDLTDFAKSLTKVVDAANNINSTDMATFTSNIQAFAAAMQPLTALQGVGDISAAINALEKLPSVAKDLSQMDLGTFAQQMQQITTAIQPFITQMQALSTAFSGLPEPIQQSVANLMDYNTRTREASEQTQGLSRALKLINFTAIYLAAKKVIGVLSGFVNTSNEYVENLNLFMVTMGDATDEALKFANTVNSLMGIDVSQWIQNQGIFKQMTSGFGMVEEKANLLSKNLTQLGYDKRLSLCGAIHIEKQGELANARCAA